MLQEADMTVKVTNFTTIVPATTHALQEHCLSVNPEPALMTFLGTFQVITHFATFEFNFMCSRQH